MYLDTLCAKTTETVDIDNKRERWTSQTTALPSAEGPKALLCDCNHAYLVYAVCGATPPHHEVQHTTRYI